MSLASENSSVIREKWVNITLFHHHFRRHDFRHTRSLSISTRYFFFFLSFFLSNLSIRCISFTSAPIFPLSFSLSRAIESCRRISPLEGVRTEKNEQKNVFLWRVARREWRRLSLFCAICHCLSNIHDVREIINETKGYTIENFNVLIDEYYNLWMRLTRERITMLLVKIRFLQTWGLVFRSAWTSRKLDNTVIIIAFLSEERIGNHVFLAMMSLRNEISSSINPVLRQWREEKSPKIFETI